MALRSAIFLDRDGTINKKAPEGEYIRDPGDLELLPGAAKAVSRINKAGIPAILVTNQRWLSWPAADLDGYLAVQRELGRLLACHGAWLDACYMCPHAADSCDCRKPAPGMLRRASADLGIDLSASIVIGDSPSDAAAGRAAGATTVLIDPRSGGEKANGTAHFTACDIGQAVGCAIAIARSIR